MTVTTFDRIAIKNALHAGADSFNVYYAGECDQGYLENRMENLRDSVAGLTVAEAREWLEAAYEQQCENICMGEAVGAPEYQLDRDEMFSQLTLFVIDFLPEPQAV